MARYFSVEEMECKCCGGLPDDGIDERLQNVLDAMRERVGGPLILSCCYRCPQHNAEVGGVPNSQHVYGRAADVHIVEVPFDKEHLFEQILSPANLNRAYKAVMRNKGCGGIDKMSCAFHRS